MVITDADTETVTRPDIRITVRVPIIRITVTPAGIPRDTPPAVPDADAAVNFVISFGKKKRESGNAFPLFVFLGDG